LSNVRYRPGNFEIEDIDFEIVDNQLFFNIKQLGGTIEGHSTKTNMFGKEESFEFLLDSDNEAIGLLWTMDYEVDQWGFP